MCVWNDVSRTQHHAIIPPHGNEHEMFLSQMGCNFCLTSTQTMHWSRINWIIMASNEGGIYRFMNGCWSLSTCLFYLWILFEVNWGWLEQNWPALWMRVFAKGSEGRLSVPFNGLKLWICFPCQSVSDNIRRGSPNIHRYLFWCQCLWSQLQSKITIACEWDQIKLS